MSTHVKKHLTFRKLSAARQAVQAEAMSGERISRGRTWPGTPPATETTTGQAQHSQSRAPSDG